MLLTGRKNLAGEVVMNIMGNTVFLNLPFFSQAI